MSCQTNKRYYHSLREKPNSCIKIKDGIFAMLDHTKTGYLARKYVFIKRSLSQQGLVSHSCSCKIHECLHITEVENIWSHSDGYVRQGIENEDVFEFRTLSEITGKWFGVRCKKSNTYGIVKETSNKKTCQRIHCQNPRNCICCE